MVGDANYKIPPFCNSSKNWKKLSESTFSGSWEITEGLQQPRERLDMRTSFRGGENGVFYTVLTDPSPFFTSVVAMEK